MTKEATERNMQAPHCNGIEAGVSTNEVGRVIQSVLGQVLQGQAKWSASTKEFPHKSDESVHHCFEFNARAGELDRHGRGGSLAPFSQ
jgi:hypothetical protein